MDRAGAFKGLGGFIHGHHLAGVSRVLDFCTTSAQRCEGVKGAAKLRAHNDFRRHVVAA